MHQYGRMPNPLNDTARRSLAARYALTERCTVETPHERALRDGGDTETLQAEYERICEAPVGETFHAKATRLARLYTLVVTHGCGADPEGC